MARGGSEGAKARRRGRCLCQRANKVAIAEAGGIAPLVELVRGGSADAKEQAAGALGNLAARQQGGDRGGGRHRAAGRAGARRQRGRQGGAAAALMNLAINDANVVAIAEAGGIAPLVELRATAARAPRSRRRGRCGTWPNNDANKVAIAKRRAAPLVELARGGEGGAPSCGGGAVPCPSTPPTRWRSRRRAASRRWSSWCAAASTLAEAQRRQRGGDRAGGIAPLIELDAQRQAPRANLASLSERRQRGGDRGGGRGRAARAARARRRGERQEVGDERARQGAPSCAGATEGEGGGGGGGAQRALEGGARGGGRRPAHARAARRSLVSDHLRP